MKNRKIIIAGGSGFIGQALLKYLGKENLVVVLGRQAMHTKKNSCTQSLLDKEDGYAVRYVKWNGKDADDTWAGELDGADLVINLSGKTVNCRYHQKQKQEILDSRLHATRAIGEAIRKAKSPPELWINAASTTIYRNSYDSPNDELNGKISDWKKDNMPDNFLDQLRHNKNRFIARMKQGKNSDRYKNLAVDFSVQVCRQWEKTFFDQPTPSTRKIALRMAITLGSGGVIIPYLNLCKLGLGGRQGSGRQMFSWVHEEDVSRMINWLFEKEKAEGIYNCVAPNVISNYSFMKTLRQVTGYKIGLPATAWMLETGAFFLGTETELILKSRWVTPTRALQEGFTFKYPLLKEALQQIISEMPRRDYHLFG